MTTQTDTTQYHGRDNTGEFIKSGQTSPKPWQVAIYPAIKRAPEQNVQEYVEIVSCGWPIAHVYGTPKAVANAKLIVASVNHADKLAEALRKLIEITPYSGTISARETLTAYESEEAQ